MNDDAKKDAEAEVSADPDPDSTAAAETAPAGTATAAAEGEPGGASDPYLELEKELADTKDKLLRALADTENLRRRAQKERDDTAKYAIANFARDVLNVADNLRRAIEAIPEDARRTDDTVKIVAEGIELTERELLAAFERCGIRKIDPMGERFNHDFHEAMFEVPTNDAPPGTVVQVMEVGYTLNDRLLRAARVGVAKALPEAPMPSEGIDTTV